MAEKFAADKNVGIEMLEFTTSDPECLKNLVLTYHQLKDKFVKGSVNTVLSVIFLDRTDCKD